MDETRAWLTLLRAPALGASTMRALLKRHGSASHALERARRDEALPAAAREALAAPDTAAIEADLRWLEPPDHHLLTDGDADYPALLRDIPAAPLALFVDGDPTHLWSAQIAIVGARSATPLLLTASA